MADRGVVSMERWIHGGPGFDGNEEVMPTNRAMNNHGRWNGVVFAAGVHLVDGLGMKPLLRKILRRQSQNLL